jgi:hypothetical protein
MHGRAFERIERIERIERTAFERAGASRFALGKAMHRSSSALILFSVVKWNTSASAEEEAMNRVLIGKNAKT